MYPTTADLVAASSNAELKALAAPEQDALRAEAILAIEGACRQSFTADGASGSGSGDEFTTLSIDGNGSRTIYLPRRLASLHELVVTDASFGAADVELSDDHSRLNIIDEGGGTNWLTQAGAEFRGRQQALFTAGAGTVQVTGVWGWAEDEFPDAIATALRFDMEDRALANAHALADTVRSARALGLSSINQGGLSAELSNREPAISTRVARILKNAELIWHGGTGALA
jgi:hypothetical protein